jgi:hypothetical protein
VHHDWNAAHETVFKTVPITHAGASALIAYAFECIERNDGNFDDAIGDYNKPNAEGEIELAGNNAIELLQSLSQFLRDPAEVVSS